MCACFPSGSALEAWRKSLADKGENRFRQGSLMLLILYGCIFDSSSTNSLFFTIFYSGIYLCFFLLACFISLRLPHSSRSAQLALFLIQSTRNNIFPLFVIPMTIYQNISLIDPIHSLPSSLRTRHYAKREGF